MTSYSLKPGERENLSLPQPSGFPDGLLNTLRRTLRSSSGSLLGGNHFVGNLPRRPCEGHVEELRKQLPDFRYRSLKKFKAVCEERCGVCATSLVSCAAYLKVHAHIHKCPKFCMHLFKNFTLYKEQKIYDACQSIKFAASSLAQGGFNNLAEKKLSEIPFVSQLEDEVVSHNAWPNLIAFPLWNIEPGIDKESKFDLSFLPPPTQKQCNGFRKKFRRYLDKHMPEIVETLSYTECMKVGPNKFYDDGEIRKDSETAINSDGPFLYQSFMTGPLSVREVWLPTKAFKASSTWWHRVAEQLLHKRPHLILSQDPEAAARTVRKRFKPCKSIDLKGSGLQFPIEYIIIVLEQLAELFPEMEERKDIAVDLLQRMSIFKDKKFHIPTRGVGLGYFTNIKVMVIDCLLEDYYVIASFDDDMLVKDNQYNACIKRLKSYGFLINEEKSGHHWPVNPWFLNVGILMDEETVLGYSTCNAYMAAAFTKRYHWERKSILQQVYPEDSHYMAFHYEKIFGYEFFKGESIEHPHNGGLCWWSKELGGKDQGAFLQAHLMPQRIYDEWNGEIPYPTFAADTISSADRKQHHFKRKRMFKDKTMIYSWDYYHLHPRMRSGESIRSHSSDLDGITPAWREILLLKHFGVSHGSLEQDIPKAVIPLLADKFPLSRDPIQAFARSEFCDSENEPQGIVCDETRERLLAISRATKVGHEYFFQKREEVNQDLEIPPKPNPTPQLDNLLFGDLEWSGPDLSGIEIQAPYEESSESEGEEILSDAMSDCMSNISEFLDDI
ncbi:polyprotein [Alaria esculenta RNA virus 1]|uniref:Polyprotein n=1 Tax=Alaria esculenta RNA virus 1 TaxID=3153340 RepID=A0AB38ZNB8_9VIRU